jgi:hypothetical protein
MSAISLIINKYNSSKKIKNILINSIFYTDIKHNLGKNKFNLIEYKNLNIYDSYFIYILDIDNIDTAGYIYQRYLSKLIVVDTNTNNLHEKQKQEIYQRYKRLYSTEFITFDLDMYTSYNTLYDKWINVTNIEGFLEEKYLNE